LAAEDGSKGGRCADLRYGRRLRELTLLLKDAAFTSLVD
jgi:hypothetical protein